MTHIRSIVTVFCILFVFQTGRIASEEFPVSLESSRDPGRFIGGQPGPMHLFSPATLEDKELTTFRIVPGLADPNDVSIRFEPDKTYFLRHQNFIVKLDAGKDESLFNEDATFRIVRNQDVPELVSFESTNYPGMFMRASGESITMSPWENSVQFKADTTFRLAPPNWDGKNKRSKIERSAVQKREDSERAIQFGVFVAITLAGSALIGMSIVRRRNRE